MASRSAAKRRRGEPAVKAGDQADGSILKRKADGPQVAGFDADVAIADDQEVVAGIFSEADQLIHLLAGAELLAAGKEANGDGRKIAYEFLDYGNSRVAIIGYVKQNFKFWIILARKAGKILVGIAIESADRF
jgi:hypothetical protein